MANITHVQRNFSGGEISPKMLMRASDDVYRRSVLKMVNYMPTPQGTALRTPGTRFLDILDDPDARVIPYLTPSNKRAVVVLRNLQARVYDNILDLIQDNVASPSASSGTVTFRKNIVDNFAFTRDLDGWIGTPNSYFGGRGEGPLGVFEDEVQDFIWLSPRLHIFPAEEDETVTLETTANVDVATNRATVDFRLDYFANPFGADAGYNLVVEISENSDYSTPFYTDSFDQNSNGIGSNIRITESVDLPTTGYTGLIYIRISLTATANGNNQSSNPQFHAQFFRVFTNGSRNVVQADLVTPYTADQLKDVQYVQSPYGNKELVFTHPNHPPQELVIPSGAYVWRPKVFTNEPSQWENNNYPSSCTAYLGRLILGGAASFETLSGDPLAQSAETIYGTEVGRWGTFSGVSSDINPDDSIEFTATYRSPVRWLYGQRALLVGTLEYEYSASGDGIFSPADLGVLLQSTHGSKNVQPAAFGGSVLFASDNGTKVRSLNYSNDEDGWVSLDLTLLNPEICFPEIVRMARCRNPHQMCLVLTSSGQVSMFHSESGVEGWSRYVISDGVVRDMCVISDDRGVDVPIFVITRNIDGTERTYLEAIANFSSVYEWDYLTSCKTYQFETATATIAGLDHLEGKVVLVRDAYRYLGFFRVSSGFIVIQDGNGTQYPVNDCIVGLQHRSILTTLPPLTGSPGSKKRFAEYSVRVLGSTRPIINGERPEDRDPSASLNLSQSLDLVKDIDVSTDGWDVYATVEISEHLPFRNEIIGVYGQLQANKL